MNDITKKNIWGTYSVPNGNDCYYTNRLWDKNGNLNHYKFNEKAYRKKMIDWLVEDVSKNIEQIESKREMVKMVVSEVMTRKSWKQINKNVDYIINKAVEIKKKKMAKNVSEKTQNEISKVLNEKK